MCKGPEVESTNAFIEQINVLVCTLHFFLPL